MGNDFVLHQDNCGIHMSKLMKEWMAKVNITTLEWPARSPDLNLIENVREMLAKEAQLWERILRAKKQLIETRRDVIVHMFDHYEERLIKVIEKKGDITDYKQFFNDVWKIMLRVFCKKWWKLNIFPYLIDFLPFLLQVLSLYVYAILLKEFRPSMVLGKSNTKMSEKYCQAPVLLGHSIPLKVNLWAFCQ